MNRTMKLLAAALVGASVVLFGTAGPAGASGESIGGCLLEQFEITEIAIELARGNDPADKFDEVIKKHPEYLTEAESVNASFDGDVEAIEEDAEGRYEDCLEAPNPLLPETNEIIWGSVGFFVVFIFLAKFGYPAIKKSMQDRSDKIRDDLDAAEAAKTEAEAEKASYTASLGDAKGEAAKIIEDARKQADTMKADAQTRLNDEIAAARATAQNDIESAKGQAMAELRGEVASIAIGAAEAVVGANLDRDRQVSLVEEYINQVQSGQN